MDTQTNRKMAGGKALLELAGKRTVVGAKQLRKALATGKATKVYLAENADPAMTLPIMEQCKLNGISFAWVSKMQDLGRACGIEVGAAAAAAVD